MAKNTFALRAFITGIVCIVMVGLGWLSDPSIGADQTGGISTFIAWASLAAAVIALIVAIYFTCRAFTIREPQKDLESEEAASGESSDPDPSSNKKS